MPALTTTEQLTSMIAQRKRKIDEMIKSVCEVESSVITLEALVAEIMATMPFPNMHMSEPHKDLTQEELDSIVVEGFSNFEMQHMLKDILHRLAHVPKQDAIDMENTTRLKIVNRVCNEWYHEQMLLRTKYDNLTETEKRAAGYATKSLMASSEWNEIDRSDIKPAPPTPSTVPKMFGALKKFILAMGDLGDIGHQWLTQKEDNKSLLVSTVAVDVSNARDEDGLAWINASSTTR